MYNAHRGIGQQPANNSNHRLSELFDQIRREFDVHAQDRAGEHDQNSRFVGCSRVVREVVSNAQIYSCQLRSHYGIRKRDSSNVILSKCELLTSPHV